MPSSPLVVLPAVVVCIAVALTYACKILGLGDLQTLVVANAGFGLACLALLADQADRSAMVRPRSITIGALACFTWYALLVVSTGRPTAGSGSVTEALAVLFAAGVEERVFRA